jgi:hypothetical protein
MRTLFFYFSVVLFVLANASLSVAEDDHIQVFPLQAFFVSEKAAQNDHFIKAISSDKGGYDHNYAITNFIGEFKKHFPNSSTNITDQNKYSTFLVYLQVPRVSQYKIKKSDTLVDLYLPMTMTISFANMGTGEILYTYTYTYYSKREATFASLQNENITIDLYRDTYNSLLEKVIKTAKENFKPFSVATVIKKEWNGLYVLDKGDTQGVVKGDTLIGPKGMPLSIIYASGNYSVAQPIMGEPKSGMVFNKLSNGNLDDLKKPKVMLMPGAGVTNGSNIPEKMIYQLFINALGKNAAFSLISIDKSFYEVQRVVTQETNLTQAVTQQRELPDLYLRLQFNGPVSTTLPSNKPDVSYDEHSVRVCGDFLDRSGRELYGKCVDEKITDEIITDIRFAREDREEVVVKNAIVKLADDFIQAVKFKRYELPAQPTEMNRVTLSDRAGLLTVEGNAQLFKNIGSVDGIAGDINVPTWLLSVVGRNATNVDAALISPITKDIPQPALGDNVLIEGMVSSTKHPLIKFKICEKQQDESIDGRSKPVYYSVVEGLEYPLYDRVTFNVVLNSIKESSYGFKSSKDEHPIKTELIDYCIEPITKVTLNSKQQKIGYSSLNYSILAGIKVFNKSDIVWKKGIQQSVTISCPNGAGEEYINYELTTAICKLMTDLAKKVEVKQE